jgi:hypothetical protein
MHVFSPNVASGDGFQGLKLRRCHTPSFPIFSQGLERNLPKEYYAFIAVLWKTTSYQLEEVPVNGNV